MDDTANPDTASFDPFGGSPATSLVHPKQVPDEVPNSTSERPSFFASTVNGRLDSTSALAAHLHDGSQSSYDPGALPAVTGSVSSVPTHLLPDEPRNDPSSVPIPWPICAAQTTYPPHVQESSLLAAILGAPHDLRIGDASATASAAASSEHATEQAPESQVVASDLAAHVSAGTYEVSRRTSVFTSSTHLVSAGSRLVHCKDRLTPPSELC